MIYIIGHWEEWGSHPIKIGYTDSESAQGRLKGIQTGNPFRLTVVHEMEGDLSDERDLHSILDTYRLTGEWFDSTKIPSGLKDALVKYSSAQTSLTAIKLANLGVLSQVLSILESVPDIDRSCAVTIMETFAGYFVEECLAKCGALRILLDAQEHSLNAFYEAMRESNLDLDWPDVVSRDSIKTLQTYYTTLYHSAVLCHKDNALTSYITEILKQDPDLKRSVIERLK